MIKKMNPKLFLVLAFFFLILADLGARYVYYKYWWYSFYDRGFKIEDVRLYGPDDAFVLVKADKSKSANTIGEISVSQNYLLNFRNRIRVGREAYDYRSDPGEAANLTFYDLTSPTLASRELDLLPILQSHGVKEQINAIVVFDEEGQTNLRLDLLKNREEGSRHKDLIYNIESDTLSNTPSGSKLGYGGDSRLYYASVRTGLLGYVDDNYNLFLDTYSISAGFRKVKDLSGTNLAKEEPKLAKAFTDGYVLYVRPGLISDEDYFNTLLHWFAPEGQDVLELYMTDEATGEKTAITSYQDYLTWSDAHPDAEK